ncbi:LORF2 protein, partial [Crocuta crocuta]
GHGETKTSDTVGWSCKMVELLWKTVCKSLKNCKNKPIPYDPPIPLSTCPIQVKTSLRWKTCVRTFIAVLLVVAPKMEATQCLSATGEQTAMYPHKAASLSNEKE